MLQTTFQNTKLEQAYNELTKLKERRLDIILPIENSMFTDEGQVWVKGSESLFLPNDHANMQIAAKMGIPQAYWTRLQKDVPALAAKNYNGLVMHELETKKEKARKVMIRGYKNDDGTATMRALLSDKYLAIDNLSILACALEVISKMQQETGIEIRVDRCDLSETNMYVRFYCPTIEEQAPEALKNYKDPANGEFGGLGSDNGIVTGFVLRNSEVGAGKFLIAPYVTILACRNGMVFKDEAYEKTHLGGKMDEGIYKDDTHEANMNLIKLQIRDNIERYVNADFLGQRVADIKEMAARKINNPAEVIQNVGKEIGLKESEIEQVFLQFIGQGSASTAFDVAQAMTGAARYMEPETQFTLQVQAANILKLVEKADRPKNVILN